MKTKLIFILLFLISLQSKAQFFQQLEKKVVEASKKVVENKVVAKAEQTTSSAVDKTLNVTKTNEDKKAKRKAKKEEKASAKLKPNTTQVKDSLS